MAEYWARLRLIKDRTLTSMMAFTQKLIDQRMDTTLGMLKREYIDNVYLDPVNKLLDRVLELERCQIIECNNPSWKHVFRQLTEIITPYNHLLENYLEDNEL